MVINLLSVFLCQINSLLMVQNLLAKSISESFDTNLSSHTQPESEKLVSNLFVLFDIYVERSLYTPVGAGSNLILITIFIYSGSTVSGVGRKTLHNGSKSTIRIQ